MKLADATTPEEIVTAVEAEDEEILEDIKVAVGKEIEAAFEDAEELSFRQNHEDSDGYWEVLGEVEWETAIDEGWGKAIEVAGSTPLLNSVNEAFNEWMWDKTREEVSREIYQPENHYENVYVSLTYQDDAEEEDVAPEGHIRIELEPQKRRLEFTPSWPLDEVPEDVLDEMVEEAAWDKYSAVLRDADSSGTYKANELVDVEGVNWVLEIDVKQVGEFIADKAREWVSEIVDKDPGTAVALLVEAVESKDPQLARKLAKTKLPQEVLASLAVSYFADDDIELIRETVGEFGYVGSRGQLLLAVTHADLAAMGIRSGRIWDGAPWALINLPSNELGYEGVRQRHCVGRHDMGYREAVDRGRIWVWSLRSQHNKPLLTWEIDRPAWEHAADDRERGNAVRQLKGKLNRDAGKDQAEAVVLLWIFGRMGIDERLIRDFNDAYKRPPFAGHAGSLGTPPPAGNPSFARRCGLAPGGQ